MAKYQGNLHLAREKITQMRKEKELLKTELKKSVEDDDSKVLTELERLHALQCVHVCMYTRHYMY